MDICKLGDIAKFTTGKLNSNAAQDNGKYPFFTCAPEALKIDDYAFDTEAIILAGNNADGNFHIQHFKGKFNAYQRTYVIESLDENKVDTKYLYYALKTCLLHFKQISQGSATKFLTAKILNSFELPIPEIEIQKKIAGTLGNLDKKIKTNEAINENLEQQLQLLYDQLTYDLKGETIELSSVIEVRDGTHDSPKPKENGFPLVTSKHLLPFGVDLTSCNLISQADYNKINERSAVDTYDILLSMIGTVGLVSLVIENPVTYAIKNVGLFKTSKRPELYAFILAYLKSKKTMQHIEKTLAGSTQKYISLGELRKMPIILPTVEQLSNYNEIANPLIKQIITLTNENKTLNMLRDSILPKLMSGEIDVSAIDI